ncbi:S49 family peptidase [Pseudorhodobacter sp. W20_MBD10_FR17]|uniref:S49 family peptidase n=1 Tax=Pseudorhodobacter sp. W20_MBD10_FR17 TaxID=3240266 RepID=UPI003F9D782A
MRKFVPFTKKPPFVPVIRLSGSIGAGSRFSPALSDASLAQQVDRAFTRGKPAAVALIINSPGGSPVQSSLIAARIRRLADEKGIPVHAFVEDVAASGGYWLACAADNIWVDNSSIVGSIGVIFASFGFPGLMAKHGVERRVHTAGTSKSLADPFLPEKPEDVARLKALQEPIHNAFINHVTSQRGQRLSTTTDLFNADVWVGQGAVDVGLADGVAHLVPKMKSLYGDKVKLNIVGERKSMLQRLGISFGGMGASLASGAMAEVEDRSLWARYGL